MSGPQSSLKEQSVPSREDNIEPLKPKPSPKANKVAPKQPMITPSETEEDVDEGYK